MESFSEPELNIKLCSVYLNLGITYIYLNNYNISEKFLRKALSQTEGMLGSEVISKLNSNIYENLGIIKEVNNNCTEAIQYYKKSLKLKFNFYGELNEEVLDLQYKIAGAYVLSKKYKDAEEILISLTDVISNEKLKAKNANIDNYYRYGSYFYTTGVTLLKLGKNRIAKQYLTKVEVLWKEILSNKDPVLQTIYSMIKLCEKPKV